MNKSDRKQHYAKMISDHESWLRTARSLYSAARLMEPEIENRIRRYHEQRDNGIPLVYPDYLELYDSYYLLIGFSFENYFKGIIALKMKVEIFNQVMKSNKKQIQPNFIHGHKLVQLSTTAGITLDKDDIRLLSGLTEFINWGGRYPISNDLESEFYGSKIYFGSSIDKIRVLVNNIASQCGFSIT